MDVEETGVVKEIHGMKAVIRLLSKTFDRKTEHMLIIKEITNRG